MQTVMEILESLPVVSFGMMKWFLGTSTYIYLFKLQTCRPPELASFGVVMISRVYDLLQP